MITKINKNVTSVLCAALITYHLSLITSSCSDWDDHFDADTQVTATQQRTLWQNIEGNGQMSQFAALLRQTGYDAVLSASQTYTVWAPLDGTFDYDALRGEGSDRLLRQFVQNHIARSNFPASGSVEENIYMLNEKMMNFRGNGTYQMQGVEVSEANLAAKNGTIHALKGKIPFLPNIYESLPDAAYPIDSISDFFHSFDSRELNEQKSVPGPVVGGEQTYLDSVFYEHNELYTLNHAYINREDSNYTMILPTNEAWSKARAQIKALYNYVPQFEFMENTSTTVGEKKVTVVTLKDAARLQDSLVNVMLLRDLFYNNNLYDNSRLSTLASGQRLQCDSLVSTTMSKVYADDAAQLFENARRVDKSNGAVWVTDSLRMRPWTSWNPELHQEAEGTMVANHFNTAGEPVSVRVSESAKNPAITGKISNGRYLQVQPSASNTNPEVDFYLSGVRSATYNVYAVFVPANITNANAVSLPSRMVVDIGYADAKGKSQEKRMRNTAAGNNYFQNDPTRIDTIYIGEFTFPVAFVETGRYYPYMRFRSNVTNALSSQYDRTLRIDCIILRPKELDEHIKEYPGYKYDHE